MNNQHITAKQVFEKEKLQEKLRERVEKIKQEKKIIPIFALVFCNPTPESLQFMAIKEKKAFNLGIEIKKYDLSHFSFDQKKEKITQLQKEKMPTLIQIPCGKLEESQEICELLEKELDIDCLNQSFSENHHYVQPVAFACQKLAELIPKEKSPKNWLVIGSGNLVGKPVFLHFKKLGFVVENTNKEDEKSLQKIKNAQGIVSGMGNAGFLTPQRIPNASIIIDAGTSELSGIIKGDMSEEAKEYLEYFSPVPGGVGPLASYKVLENVIEFYERFYTQK